MSFTFQIKRRISGTAGPPATLKAGELAFNEVDNTLYYGNGDNGNGIATSVIAIGGAGTFLLDSAMGVPGGVATLGPNGLIPSSQVPIPAAIANASQAGMAVLLAPTVEAQRTSLKIDTLTTIADADYQMTAGDFNVEYSSLTRPRTLTLPSANALPGGTIVRIGDTSGSCSTTITLSVVPSGSDKINQLPSYTIAMAFGQVALQTDGTAKWTMLGQTMPVATNVNGGNY